MLDKTMIFSLGEEKDDQIKAGLTIVYDALRQKGYNPINQIVGYILSEDPTYITTYNNARNIISKIDRDDLLEALVKSYLNVLDLNFTVDPKIVRGLDYYTKTVFEFVTTDIGAQGTICGGGRYDGLIEQLGGQSVPALGFAMGLERLILTMENQGIEFDDDLGCSLYIAPMDQNAVPYAMSIAKEIRSGGFQVEFDTIGRSLKAQMKYSDKIDAAFTLVLGDNEINSKTAKLKNMKTGEQTDIKLDDSLLENFSNIALDNMFGSFTD